MTTTQELRVKFPEKWSAGRLSRTAGNIRQYTNSSVCIGMSAVSDGSTLGLAVPVVTGYMGKANLFRGK
jgi:hypothetical protein